MVDGGNETQNLNKLKRSALGCSCMAIGVKNIVSQNHQIKFRLDDLWVRYDCEYDRCVVALNKSCVRL